MLQQGPHKYIALLDMNAMHIHIMACAHAPARSQRSAAQLARFTRAARPVRAPPQIWRSPFPPKRGHALLGTCPMVHSGFLQSWAASGLNQRVLQVRWRRPAVWHSWCALFSLGALRLC